MMMKRVNMPVCLIKNWVILTLINAAVVIERLIRGLNPWPSAYTYMNGKTLKIWEADVLDRNYGCAYGEVAEVRKDSIVIQTRVGALAIKSVQLEGKKRMDAAAFLNGNTIEKGMRFGKQDN